MPRYLDTRGHSKLAIAVCARCGVKYPWDQLSPDPNTPGLMVCPDGCRDQFDPWRLAPRPTEDITMAWARPDQALGTILPMKVPVLPLQAVVSPDGATGLGTGAGIGEIAVAPPVSQVVIAQPWSAGTAYRIGSQVTIGAEYGPAVAASTMKVFLCIVPGKSGAAAPAWNQADGAYTEDFQVIWVCGGYFLP